MSYELGGMELGGMERKERMATEKKIDELLKIAVTLELEGVEFIQSLDYATLCREYNGIGAEWLGEKLRERITRYLHVFEPAALIHDLRNSRSDGSIFGFHFANDEFGRNCRRLADAAYPWWSWRRYRARAVARALHALVESAGGWLAWLECFAKNNKSPTEGECNEETDE